MPKFDVAKDLWVNPRLNLKGPEGNRAWDNSGNISPNGGARFLELGDIALGLKKPTAKKTNGAAAGAPETTGNTEPRSG